MLERDQEKLASRSGATGDGCRHMHADSAAHEKGDVEPSAQGDE